MGVALTFFFPPMLFVVHVCRGRIQTLIRVINYGVQAFPHAAAHFPAVVATLLHVAIDATSMIRRSAPDQGDLFAVCARFQ